MIDIVERCLQKEPGERFANAAELALALEPLAPPESRVTVERARMAMGSTGRGPMVSSPALDIAAAETPPARPAPTPAAWGSGKQGTLVSGAQKSSGGMWIGAGIAVAAIVGGARLPAPQPRRAAGRCGSAARRGDRRGATGRARGDDRHFAGGRVR